MNIKLFTPKTLKAGSGLATTKQLLLSVVATSISIVLTFGTAAIIDSKKKQREKHEIVMMVMYDMYNSLQSVERCDSMIRQSMLIQLQIAKDTTLYDKLKYQLIHLAPRIDFTETTERIYSSSIETINTVGNVLFTESVAKFYLARNNYKTVICDSISNDIRTETPFMTLKGTLNFDYSFDALASNEILQDMQNLFAQCQQLMGIGNKEIEAYHKKREQLEQNTSEAKESKSTMDEILQLQQAIDDSRKTLGMDE